MESKHKMVILGAGRETTIPISEQQYQNLKSYLGSDKCIVDACLFADEDELVEELDNAIKTKL